MQNEQLAVRNMLTKTESGDFLVAGNPIKVRATAPAAPHLQGSWHDVLVWCLQISGFKDFETRADTPILDQHGKELRAEAAAVLKGTGGSASPQAKL